MGDPSAFDRYSYVKSNPISRLDPTGHLCQEFDIGGHNATICNTDKVTAPIIPGAKLIGSSYDPDSMWSINRTGIDAAEYWILNYSELLSPGLLKVSGRLNQYLEKKEGVLQEMDDRDGSIEGNCTDGIGHRVHPGKCIKNGGNSELYSTAEEPFNNWLEPQTIDDWYEFDISNVEKTLNQNIHVPLTQNQVDALASLVFNAGPKVFGTFEPSELYEALNQHAGFNLEVQHLSERPPRVYGSSGFS